MPRARANGERGPATGEGALPARRRASPSLALAAVLVGFGCLGLPARAAEPADLYLEGVVNERAASGIGRFRLTADGRLEARREDLHALGLKPPGTGGDDDLVDINAIQGFNAKYDAAAQRLTFDVKDPSLLETVSFNGQTVPLGARSAPIETTGGVLDYIVFGAVQSQSPGMVPSFSGASANLDARVFSPLGILRQSAIVGTTTMRDADFIRLDTSYTFSDADRMVKARVGDMITDGPAWVRPVRLGGASFARDYTLRADIVTAALPVVNGTAAAPSTVDVFVNGVKAYSQDVPAGPFSLNNIPGVTGAGNAQVVVRDVTGREVRGTMPFFTSASVLKKGSFDYAVNGGFARYDYATAATTYGVDPVLVAAARYGLTDAVTLETYNEGGAGLVGLGAGATVNVFGFGVLSAAGRASRLGERNGFDAYASWQTRLGPATLSGSIQRTFGDFEDLVSATGRPDRIARARSLEFARMPAAISSTDFTAVLPTRQSAQFTVSAPGFWSGSSVSLSAIAQTNAVGQTTRILATSLAQQFGRDVSLFATGYVNRGSVSGLGIFAGLNVIIDPLDSVSTSASSAGHMLYGTVEGTRAQRDDVGDWGARVRLARSGPDGAAGVGGSYQTSVGQMTASADYQAGSTNARAEMQGAIVAMPGVLAATRRIDDGFAVVETGAPGVEVIQETRKVGTTDANGRLVLPDLLSRNVNHIAVDPLSLPADASLARTEAEIVPPPLAGVIVDFKGKSDSRAATLILRDASGKELAAGLQGHLAGSDEPFIVGTDGRAYVRGLAEHNEAVVDVYGAECRVAFSYEPRAGAAVEIGPLTCK